MRVIERNANAEAYARRSIAPVTDGLVWWGVINGDQEKVSRNLATGQQVSVVGSPTIASTSGRFDAPGQYVASSVAETASMTFCFAAKAVSDPVNIGAAPVIAGNYTASPYGGAMMWFTTAAGGAPLPAAALRFTVVTGTTANQCSLQVSNASDWHFYIGVISSGQVAIYNMTDRTVATLSTFGARALGASRIRVGSNVSTSFGGIVDLAGGAIYNRALSESEREAVYTYWSAVYLASKGIAV